MIRQLIFSFFLLGIMALVEIAEGLELTGSLEGISLAAREDSLRWKVKENIESLPVIKEFCFDNIKMAQWGLKSQVTVDGCYSLKCLADYAIAYNKTRDSAYDISIGAGYHYYFCDCSFRITPYAGFEINRQRFKSCMDQYSAVRVKLRDPLPEPNYFANLNTRYRAHWYGPWLGLDMDYMIACDWKAYASFAYYFSRIRGKFHSGFGDLVAEGFALRDVISQHGYGHGIGFGLGVQYAIAENWLLDFSGWFEGRHVCGGKQHGKHWFETKEDVLDVVTQNSSSDEEDDGSNPIRNHLKHIEWRSFRVEVALCFVF